MMTAPTCSKLYILGIYLTPTPPREKNTLAGLFFGAPAAARPRINRTEANRSGLERIACIGDIPGQHDNQRRQPEKKLTFPAWLEMQNKQIIKPL
ncbi:hypothetical protein CSN29_09075 [Salmonella enterica subsp. diarizonae]|nr:hypothetical protein [Salmonella enterica]ECC3881098.1 hypothetical protein [Salmonella enterica subsp. diarizonae]